MSTTTSGATIFYTKDGSTTPTHNGGTATGSTQVYTTALRAPNCTVTTYTAIAYKSGMADSNVTSYDADYTDGNNCGGGGGMSPMTGSSNTTIFSVWDGDWAILEEYTTGNVRVESYVQGYHGLVKTMVDNIYYYQDELGSTSHVANASGALLEYYKYDLYGKPTYWDNTNHQIPSSNYQVKDLHTGARWIPELGLYDDRNRFMSPDLGRFLQPDPIGFKGDSSNLYRYCGNDWANRSDPTGLDFIDEGDHSIQLGPRGEYGYTKPTPSTAGVTYTKADGGVQAHVKDFNLRVKSYVAQKAQVVRDGKVITFDRTTENKQRTSNHEAEHREKNREWYNENHDKVLKDLNNGQTYKDQKAAEDAMKKIMGDAFRDFNNKDFNHREPVWHDYKAPRLELPPDAKATEPPKEPKEVAPDHPLNDPGLPGGPFFKKG